MAAFKAIMISHFKLLARNKTHIIGSMGIAVISMLLFGWVFGGEGAGINVNIGITQKAEGQLQETFVNTLEGMEQVTLVYGEKEELIEGLKKGQTSVVLEVPEEPFVPGQEPLVIQAYYDASSPMTLQAAQGIVSQTVTGINYAITGHSPVVSLQWESVDVKKIRYIDFLTPGLLGMLLMWANLYVGVGLISMREQGILKRLGVTPLRPLTFISGKTAAQVWFSLFQAVIFIGIAMAMFDVTVASSKGLLLFLIILGSLSMMSIGFLIGSFVPKTESANAVTMMISFPMMFLSGSYFPVDGAPKFLEPLIRVLPLTHLNEALRSVFNSQVVLWDIQTAVLVLLAWIAGSILVSSRVFRWQ